VRFQNLIESVKVTGDYLLFNARFVPIWLGMRVREYLPYMEQNRSVIGMDQA
jgi:hypothetical protein